ncbi:MAG: CPBP family intramembrane metalloprotease [Bacteroidales bacterium]|nr:CPBP family intramembrane metalloprotease [Bacteroidales bacterium]
MGKRRGNFNFYQTFEYFSPKWKGILGLVFWFIIGALLGNGIVLVMTKFLGQQAALEYGTVISYPIMFIPPMVFAAVRSRRKEMQIGAVGSPLDQDGFAPLGGWLCAALVMVVTLASGVISDGITSLLPPMPEWLEDALKNMTSGNFWLNFLCVSIFAPIFEEWLCRGMVLRGLLDRGVKPFWAILFSAVFFGLIHLNIWQMIPAILIGVVLGYVYWKTRSLKLTMLMHFTNNTFALILSHIDSLKDAEGWMQVLGEWYWPAFAACLLLVALFFVTFRRIPAPAAE